MVPESDRIVCRFRLGTHTVPYFSSGDRRRSACDTAPARRRRSQGSREWPLAGDQFRGAYFRLWPVPGAREVLPPNRSTGVAWTGIDDYHFRSRFSAHGEAADISYVVDSGGGLRWVSMPRWGNAGNRSFEYLACGGTVEEVKKLRRLFGTHLPHGTARMTGLRKVPGLRRLTGCGRIGSS